MQKIATLIILFSIFSDKIEASFSSKFFKKTKFKFFSTTDKKQEQKLIKRFFSFDALAIPSNIPLVGKKCESEIVNDLRDQSNTLVKSIGKRIAIAYSSADTVLSEEEKKAAQILKYQLLMNIYDQDCSNTKESKRTATIVGSSFVKTLITDRTVLLKSLLNSCDTVMAPFNMAIANELLTNEFFFSPIHVLVQLNKFINKSVNNGYKYIDDKEGDFELYKRISRLYVDDYPFIKNVDEK